MSNILTKYFWTLRNALLDYRDDFDYDQTQARLNNLDAIVMPGIQAAQGDDVYILRGIAHFRAQRMVRTRTSMILAELISLPLLLAGAAMAALRGQCPEPQQMHVADAFLMLSNKESQGRTHIYKIPADLAHLNIAKIYVPRSKCLVRDDWMMLKRLAQLLKETRCPYPVQYMFKAFKDLLYGRAYIQSFRDARVAIISQEYSCSMSLLTLQQHKAGKALYNIMHGDNAATVLESYFVVDRFYCWAPFYAGLFEKQRIAAAFPISPNPDFMLKAGERVADDGIGVLVPMMNFLPAQYPVLDDLIGAYAQAVTRGLAGQPATLRAHPAYPWTLEAYVNHTYSDTYAVSDAQRESSHEFVLRHRTLIGFYSTVLMEAASLGCNVIIIRYPASDARARYHGVFGLPNVRHIDLADLPAMLASLTTPTDTLRAARYGS